MAKAKKHEDTFSERNNSYEGAHELTKKGDPRVNGPYLDDIRAAQEDARREGRMKYYSEADVPSEDEVALANSRNEQLKRELEEENARLEAEKKAQEDANKDDK